MADILSPDVDAIVERVRSDQLYRKDPGGFWQRVLILEYVYAGGGVVMADLTLAHVNENLETAMWVQKFRLVGANVFWASPVALAVAFRVNLPLLVRDENGNAGYPDLDGITSLPDADDGFIMGI